MEDVTAEAGCQKKDSTPRICSSVSSGSFSSVASAPSKKVNVNTSH